MYPYNLRNKSHRKPLGKIIPGPSLPNQSNGKPLNKIFTTSSNDKALPSELDKVNPTSHE